MIKFNKITIIGVGLIGGSIGLAVKKNKMAREVVGVFRRPSSLKKALKRKAIDWGTLDMEKGASGADIVIVATGVEKIATMIKMAVPFARPGCIFTDVGSVKAEIVKGVELFMPSNKFFIGSHPMAGLENSGVEHAKSDLFVNATTILTPTKHTNKKALSAIKALWGALGSKVEILTPDKHDNLICQVSHLPHLMAAAVSAVPAKEALKFAAGGYRDTTRIASSDPKLWAQISIMNRKNLECSVIKAMGILESLKKSIASGNKKELINKLKKYKAKRDSILQ